MFYCVLLNGCVFIFFCIIGCRCLCVFLFVMVFVFWCVVCVVFYPVMSGYVVRSIVVMIVVCMSPALVVPSVILPITSPPKMACISDV